MKSVELGLSIPINRSIKQIIVEAWISKFMRIVMDGLEYNHIYSSFQVDPTKLEINRSVNVILLVGCHSHRSTPPEETDRTPWYILKFDFRLQLLDAEVHCDYADPKNNADFYTNNVRRLLHSAAAYLYTRRSDQPKFSIHIEEMY